MELKIRTRGGDINSARNLLDTRIVWGDFEGKEVHSVVHTIEVIEGAMTHGGGAPEGEYLHYKGQDTDFDQDGIIDYTDTMIHTAISMPGKVSLKVKAKVMFKDDVDAHAEAWTSYNEEFNAEVERLKGLHGPDQASYDFDYAVWLDENSSPAANVETHTVESNSINLEWLEDSDSDWI